MSGRIDYFFIAALTEVFFTFSDLVELDIDDVVADLLDPADINSLHDVARVSGSIQITPRGLSHFIPLMAAISASPSALPLVFLRAS